MHQLCVYVSVCECRRSSVKHQCLIVCICINVSMAVSACWSEHFLSLHYLHERHKRRCPVCLHIDGAFAVQQRREMRQLGSQFAAVCLQASWVKAFCCICIQQKTKIPWIRNVWDTFPHAHTRAHTHTVSAAQCMPCFESYATLIHSTNVGLWATLIHSINVCPAVRATLLWSIRLQMNEWEKVHFWTCTDRPLLQVKRIIIVI